MKVYLLQQCFSFLSFIVSSLPDSWVVRLAKILGKVFSRIDISKRGKDARANLNFVYGNQISDEEKRRIIERVYVNFFYNTLDFFRLGSMSREALSKRVVVEGEAYIHQALASGRPLIMTGSHYGDWELSSLYFGITYMPLTILGRLFDDPLLDRVIFKTRERFGITLLGKKGAIRELVKALSAGKSIGMTIDQNTKTEEGLLVDFLGKKVRHTPTASILARRFDAYIVPVFIRSDENYTKHTLIFKEPFLVNKSADMERDILEATQRQAKNTEAIILEKPDDWFWFHRRFKNQNPEVYR